VSEANIKFGRHTSREPVSIRRVGVVTNFAASDDVTAAFETVVARFVAMQIATVQVRVPFEAASFDVSNVETDRATINASLFADVDAIVLPTLTSATPTVDEARARGDLAVSAGNTFFANYYGLPAISVPSGVDKSGMPVGVQFVGPSGGDVQVLSLAAAYLRSKGWRYVPPGSGNRGARARTGKRRSHFEKRRKDG
jgi:aspartyl-tRNA(Asn)/glutamyl-tRNA(Gln) amidotransferase subunit A